MTAIRHPLPGRVGNVALATGFVLLANLGAGSLMQTRVPTSAARDLRIARRAFADGDYRTALEHFRSASDAEAASSAAAQGAACSAWRLGDGDSAMVFQQRSVWTGTDLLFAGDHNCYGSVAPFRMLGTIRVGALVLIYRRPRAEDPPAQAALTEATRIAPSNRARAALLVSCLNARGGLDALAALHLRYAERLVDLTADPAVLRDDFERCRR